MLEEMLRERADRIRDGWVDSVLATYPAQTRAAWSRERDRFANPVGNSLRTGMRRVLETLLDRGDAAEIRTGLDEMVRIRAVQQMSAAEAVGFVFHLKRVVRAEMAEMPDGGWSAAELVAFEDRIDRAALVAFDLYVGYRQQVSELRIAELKRNIPWAAQREGFEGCAVPGVPGGPSRGEPAARCAESAGEESE